MEGKSPKNRQLYLEYHSLFKRAYPNLSKGECQEEANNNWKSFLKGKQLDYEDYSKGVSRLKQKLASKKCSMMNYMLKPKSSKPTSNDEPALNKLDSQGRGGGEPGHQQSDGVPGDGEQSADLLSSDTRSSKTDLSVIDEASFYSDQHLDPHLNGALESPGGSNPLEDDAKTHVDDGQTEDNVTTTKYATPTQDKLKEKIGTINARLITLDDAKQMGLGPESNALLNKEVRELKTEKKNLEQRLRRNKGLIKAQKKWKEKNKKALRQAMRDFPGLENSIKVRSSAGRPPLEDIYPSLHSDILSIATIGAACSDKRREDLFRSVKTTSQLHSALDEMGYKLSKSSLYRRLLPKHSKSDGGKRHVRTVPVRLTRPENNLRKKHPDRMFAAESYNTCYKLAETLGPLAAVAASFDDKSSVHIGVTAAKRQGAMLMNMSYRVRLPDHDFNVAARHLLCPSVVAVHHVKENGVIGYSGETYVAVRSQKHNNSTAYSHHEDLLRVIELFPQAFKTGDGRVKPVIIKGTDGGPDENPRFEKNLFMGAKTFQEHDLDLYVEVTNAPGLSAFNKVERKMYHLSKELTGVLLQHDTYGSHLDNAGKTIDEELEKRNFEAAGKTLCSIWSNLEVDGYPTVAEFIKESPPDDIKSFVPTAEFRSNHLFESQYMTVYIKCHNLECCSPFLTNVEAFFPHRRLPPLIPIMRTQFGVAALKRSADYDEKKIEFLPLAERILFEDSLITPEDKQKFGASIPYDLYFPTLQEKLEKRVCVKCFKYHASIKSLNVHKKVCSLGKRKPKKVAVATQESSESEDEVEDRDTNGNEVSLAEEDIDEHAQQADLVRERPTFSVAHSSVEIILDLKEWLKSPWVELEEDDNS